MNQLTVLVSMVLALSALEISAVEESPVTLENVKKLPEISPDEPLRSKFSAPLAAHYLDSSALHWQKQRKCGTCHTNFAYLAVSYTHQTLPTNREV
mgnify:CR=1 FL=1